MSSQKVWSIMIKPLQVLGSIIKYGCIVHCTLEFVADFVICKGSSMEPSIYSDDVIMTEHLSSRFNNIHKGDIVVCRSPLNPHFHICKRVAGLAGDKVKQGAESVMVPKGHLWLQGDNDLNSTDSRDFGPVPKGLLHGKALFRVWPPSAVGSLAATNRDISTVL